MNRDPFDWLRSRNPVPPESLPDAPPTVASSIISGRPSWRRGLAIAWAAAVSVLVVGGAWLLWSQGGERKVASDTPTTGVEGTAPTIPGPGDTFAGAAASASTVVVYFLDEQTSTLVPVSRDLSVLNVRPLPDPGPLTVDLLLRGPGAWDAGPLPDPVADAEAQMASAIPDGTRLLGLSVDPTTVTVDLSAEFIDAPPRALAQVVFTLTRLEGVEGVRFLIEGEPHRVLAQRLALVPPTPLPTDTAIVDPVTRTAFADFLPPVMIESPAMGGTLQIPAVIAGAVGRELGDVLLQLLSEDGTVLWSATTPATCPGCAAGSFRAEVPDSVGGVTGWATLRAYLSTLEHGPLAEYPVWLTRFVPPTDEPGIPEATTTTSTIAADAAPWSGAALADDAVPGVVADTWAAADNRDECAVLFPADPGSLAQGAVLHDRYFGGGWGLAWDLPSGPGRWEPGGEYCADCGGEAFGVAGTGGDALGTEDAIWPHHLAWTDGSAAGRDYAHAGYGYEALSPTGEAGEPMLAYLFIDGQSCMYNVWSFLGEEHLLSLIEQLRFVEGVGTP